MCRATWLLFNLKDLCRVIDLSQPLKQYLANPAVKRGYNFLCPGLFTTNEKEKKGWPRIRYFLISPSGALPMNWMRGADEVRFELARQPNIDEVLQASRSRRRNLGDSAGRFYLGTNPGATLVQRRLDQDPCEHHFSHVRQAGGSTRAITAPVARRATGYAATIRLIGSGGNSGTKGFFSEDEAALLCKPRK